MPQQTEAVPTDLSRQLSLVTARKLGVSPGQLPLIGTDPELFDAFYSEHVEDVLRFVARRVGNRERAADLTSEIFLAAIDSAHRYRPRGTPKAWLYGIARVVVANDRRRSVRERSGQARLRGSALLDEEEAALIDARIEAATEARRMYGAIDRLPEGERAVLELVAIDEPVGRRRGGRGGGASGHRQGAAAPRPPPSSRRAGAGADTVKHNGR